MSKTAISDSLLGFVSLLFAAAPLVGQSPATPKYGTTRVTSTTALATDFTPPSPAVEWSLQVSPGGAVSRYQTTESPDRWWAPFRAPDGAKVEGLNIEACDFSPTGQLVFGLRRTRFDEGEDILPIGGTGVTMVSGCSYSYVGFDTPITIDNSNYDYWLFVAWDGDYSASLRLTSVLAGYRLQVSPDPGYATFLDVPIGHPLHQFVEALAYSDITAGCGGGNFCPNSPLTRGQMAVFLAKALGLSWP
jgi:hypothetical protein